VEATPAGLPPRRWRRQRRLPRSGAAMTHRRQGPRPGLLLSSRAVHTPAGGLPCPVSLSLLHRSSHGAGAGASPWSCRWPSRPAWLAPRHPLAPACRHRGTRLIPVRWRSTWMRAIPGRASFASTKPFRCRPVR
jgi:hypothetical protein